MSQSKGFDISNLPLEQLNLLKQNTESEIEVLTSSINQLRLAASKFLDSKRVIITSSSDTKGKKVLVPLTSSMYIPAALSDPEHVLVDIGTGYYVKKTVADAAAYADRRYKTVTEQVMQLVQALAVKKKNLDAVVSVMQGKVEYMQEQQEKSAK